MILASITEGFNTNLVFRNWSEQSKARSKSVREGTLWEALALLVMHGEYTPYMTRKQVQSVYRFKHSSQEYEMAFYYARMAGDMYSIGTQEAAIEYERCIHLIPKYYGVFLEQQERRS